MGAGQTESQATRERDRARIAATLRDATTSYVAGSAAWCAPLEDPTEAFTRAGLSEGPATGTPTWSELRCGTLVELRDAPERPLDRCVGLGAVADRLAACGSTRLLVQHADGSFGYVRPGCGSRACPVCVAARSARRWAQTGQLWGQLAGDAIAEGGAVLHLTLTGQAVGWETPPVLGAREAIKAGFHPELDEGKWTDAGAACGGPSLRGALDRAWSCLRDSRQSRRGREAWRHVRGALIAREATGCEPHAVPKRYRFHAHIHAALVVGPEATAGASLEYDSRRRGDVVVGPWIDDVVGGWLRAVEAHGWHAEARNQTPRPVGGWGIEDWDIGRALRQVVKYPVAIHRCSDAQIAEAIAGMYGLRHIEPGGEIRSRNPSTPAVIDALANQERREEARKAESARLLEYLTPSGDWRGLSRTQLVTLASDDVPILVRSDGPKRWVRPSTLLQVADENERDDATIPDVEAEED